MIIEEPPDTDDEDVPYEKETTENYYADQNDELALQAYEGYNQQREKGNELRCCNESSEFDKRIACHGKNICDCIKTFFANEEREGEYNDEVEVAST